MDSPLPEIIQKLGLPSSGDLRMKILKRGSFSMGNLLRLNSWKSASTKHITPTSPRDKSTSSIMASQPHCPSQTNISTRSSQRPVKNSSRLAPGPKTTASEQIASRSHSTLLMMSQLGRICSSLTGASSLIVWTQTSQRCMVKPDHTYIITW